LTYNEKGINNDPDTWHNRPPLLEDLYKILKGMAEPEARALSGRLEKYVFGSAAGVFNQETNINIQNKFTVFSIRDLQDDLRPIAMYMVLISFGLGFEDIRPRTCCRRSVDYDAVRGFCPLYLWYCKAWS
jgi:hypothetical protein